MFRDDPPERENLSLGLGLYKFIASSTVWQERPEKCGKDFSRDQKLANLKKFRAKKISFEYLIERRGLFE